jgi:hypothetical protein
MKIRLMKLCHFLDRPQSGAQLDWGQAPPPPFYHPDPSREKNNRFTLLSRQGPDPGSRSTAPGAKFFRSRSFPLICSRLSPHLPQIRFYAVPPPFPLLGRMTAKPWEGWLPNLGFSSFPFPFPGYLTPFRSFSLFKFTLPGHFALHLSALLRIRDVFPDPDFYPSRIQKQQEREGWKKIVVIPFL